MARLENLADVEAKVAGQPAIDGVVQSLRKTGRFDASAVGTNTVSAVSIMLDADNKPLAGNVHRRFCAVNDSCMGVCAQRRGGERRTIQTAGEQCADENLRTIIDSLGAKPQNTLMIYVGDTDNIGFVDEIDRDFDKYQSLSTSTIGVKEMSGFNAFFAAEGDTINNDEVTTLGRHLADCCDINLQFESEDGRQVMGFMHLNRFNMLGKDNLQHDYKGKKVGVFEYFLKQALEHYNADVASVQVRIAAATKREDYDYQFKSAVGQSTDVQAVDERFPGWVRMRDESGMPFITNTKRAFWRPGRSFDPDDVWLIDMRAMLRWQMDQVLNPDQIAWEGVISPGDLTNGHASNTRSLTHPYKNGRDGYFTAWASRLQI
jgi:hypothetical protein